MSESDQKKVDGLQLDLSKGPATMQKRLQNTTETIKEEHDAKKQKEREFQNRQVVATKRVAANHNLLNNMKSNGPENIDLKVYETIDFNGSRFFKKIFIAAFFVLSIAGIAAFFIIPKKYFYQLELMRPTYKIRLNSIKTRFYMENFPKIKIGISKNKSASSLLGSYYKQMSCDEIMSVFPQQFQKFKISKGEYTHYFGCSLISRVTHSQLFKGKEEELRKARRKLSRGRIGVSDGDFMYSGMLAFGLKDQIMDAEISQHCPRWKNSDGCYLKLFSYFFKGYQSFVFRKVSELKSKPEALTKQGLMYRYFLESIAYEEMNLNKIKQHLESIDFDRFSNFFLKVVIFERYALLSLQNENNRQLREIINIAKLTLAKREFVKSSRLILFNDILEFGMGARFFDRVIENSIVLDSLIYDENLMSTLLFLSKKHNRHKEFMKYLTKSLSERWPQQVGLRKEKTKQKYQMKFLAQTQFKTGVQLEQLVKTYKREYVGLDKEILLMDILARFRSGSTRQQYKNLISYIDKIRLKLKKYDRWVFDYFKGIVFLSIEDYPRMAKMSNALDSYKNPSAKRLNKQLRVLRAYFQNSRASAMTELDRYSREFKDSSFKVLLDQMTTDAKARKKMLKNMIPSIKSTSSKIQQDMHDHPFGGLSFTKL